MTHFPTFPTIRALCLSALAFCPCAALATAETSPSSETDSLAALRADFEALKDRNSALESRNEVLAASLEDQSGAWLNEARAGEIRGQVQDVLLDSQSRTSLQDSGMSAGYTSGKGFFLANQDGSFSLRITGQIQTRWVLNHTKQSFANRGTDTDNSPQNTWGFQIRRAKVKFKGTVIDPNFHRHLMTFKLWIQIHIIDTDSFDDLVLVFVHSPHVVRERMQQRLVQRQ